MTVSMFDQLTSPRRRGRPRLEVHHRRPDLHITLEPQVLERLDVEAAALSVTRSELIARLIRSGLPD